MTISPNQKLNRKAMMDDFFDLIFTVMVSFFLLFFLNFTFQNSVENSNKQSLENVADFNRLDSAVNNLRVQLHQGNSLAGKNIPSLIQESKILGGKVITSCADYFTKPDCEKDIVAIYEDDDTNKCIWKESSKNCYTMHISMAGG